MSTKFIAGILVLTFSAVTFFLAGCGDNGDNSGSIAVQLQWNDTKNVGKSLALAPTGVTTVRVIISRPGMDDRQEDFTAADGTGTISRVPAGSGITVKVQGIDNSAAVTYEGFARDVTVEAGKTTTVGPINLKRLCNISGSVRDNAGRVIAAASVTLSGTSSATTVTDSSGNYQFNSISEGSYTVSIAASGYTFSQSSIPLNLNGICPGSQNFIGTAEVQCSVSGRVTTSSGTAISGVTVTLSGTTGSPTTTDTNGNYTIPGVSSGSHTLSVTKSGFSFNRSSILLTIGSGICPGAQNFVGTQDPPCALNGSVKTATGEAIAGTTVSLSGSGSGTRVTDSSGNFTFEGVASHGNYTLTAVKSGFSFTPLSLPLTLSGTCPGPQNFIGERTGDSRITGCVATPSGTRVAGITINLTGQLGEGEFTTVSSSTGAYQFTGIKDGTYTLTPVSAGSTFTPPNYSPLITNGSDTFILGCFTIFTSPAKRIVP